MCCFWCVYKSMNCLRESQCPICRHQYYHFPTVCQMLHFLLLKIFSVAYKRRENQILEEEKKSGLYSPQFDPNTCESQAKFGHASIPSSSSIMNSAHNSCNVRTSECTKQSESFAHKEDESIINYEHSSDGKPNNIIETSMEGKNLLQEEFSLQQKISIVDVMCTTCNQLLFHPVVLNCGHVHCETCVIKIADEMLRCQVCQSPHPRGFPKVCLEFDHFLEEQFPIEYGQRKDATELRQIEVKGSLDDGNKGENIDRWSNLKSKVHIGIGCDYCGMFPILGDRYRCIECREKMGFDLCGDCYKSRSKLPGRFNQQHTSEHTFKHIQPNMVYNILMRLATGQLPSSSVDMDLLENLEITDRILLVDDDEDNQNDSEDSN
ncbi:E3 ubiquitin-protein ligase PRT1-like isoform X2 [Abrus precatorius]|uniref:E3 ubiquitin-protein ligase PRT1-like isoform X2 n=2 Tax=Abrus precatorius TaxID=3816 RepID=A0A8B8L8A4_ABRPR|nr:E3 ubiquitin-protein ligase PRT1-like isoform X2 [Abrus precatorius]